MAENNIHNVIARSSLSFFRQQLAESLLLDVAQRQACIFRSNRRIASAVKPNRHPNAAKQERARPQPQNHGLSLEWRVQQDIIPIAIDNILPRLDVAVARYETLTKQNPQIAGQIGIRIVDRLVLTDQTPKVPAQCAGSGLQLRILQDLVRLNGQNRIHPYHQQRQKESQNSENAR
jgi:hypothetical protein